MKPRTTVMKISKCLDCGSITAFPSFKLCYDCFKRYKKVASETFPYTNAAGKVKYVYIIKELQISYKMQSPEQIQKTINNSIECDYVYFITDNDGAMKIGYSHDPQARMHDLQVGNKHKLKLIACTIGSKKLESTIHKNLRCKRLSGEWYRYDEETKDIMKSLGITITFDKGDLL